MDNRRWVIALDKRTGKRMEFTMCDLNNVAFYQSKYTLDGYDVKVYDGDEQGELLFDGSGLEYMGWKNWE